MRVVIGLGNPGGRYAATRHNAGFMVVDQLAARHATGWSAAPAARCHLAQGRLGPELVWFAKPQTFMNRSGDAVSAVVARLEVGPAELLVVLDDFLLDFGRLRFRRGGSDGGHNGLASVLEAAQTDAVPRLRVGVGQPPPGVDIIEYVLSDFPPQEDVQEMVTRAAAAVEYYAEAGMDAAMNRYNGL